MKKYLAWLLTIAMVLTLFPATVGATGSTGENAKDLALLEEEMRQALFAADDRKYSEDYVEPETDDPDEIVRVIVEMKAAPALQVASTAATVQALNAETAALKSQEATISAVRRKLDLEPVHRTGYLVNTVSYDIRRGDMEKLRSIPGVTNVTLAMKYEPELFSAKEMTDVYDAWKIGQNGYTGKGISIAIIDSGVNWQHQDMVQDPNAAKYTKTQMEELIAKLGHGKWFSDKVPFGHSYVAGHDEIISQANAHGHHVAGIAAANGPESEARISGVAPDAQILAMQVFDPVTAAGGYSDDIICAIEDSVKLGADIINMSLGSDFGFSGTDQYIEHAVNAAEEAGIFVAVSAGNAGISTDICKAMDETITNDWNMADVGTVGDPSTAAGAVSVASVDSQGFLTYGFSVTAEGENPRHIECIRLASAHFNFADRVGFVDGGTGSYEELDALSNVAEGKIVLVQYDSAVAGEYAIGNMVYTAQYAGFAGIIICNVNEELPRDVSFDSNIYFTIPAAFVGAEDGAYLIELCKTGTTAALSSYDDAYYFNTEGGQSFASSFTSWGPTPTLELKPELAAPGGNILSTGDGSSTYVWMSGTSMASPFVAGASALVKQYIQETGLPVEDVPEFIRQTLMNTAEPVYDAGTGNMASVRQVGAGMVNLEKAVQNKVIATYNGKAAIELLDNLGRKTQGEILLTNYGTEPVTYTLSADNVYTDTTDEETKLYYISVLSNATVSFPTASITVPANGTATVSFTLTIEQMLEGHFAEGYIRFTSDSAPSLSMPFLGFMGSWDKEAIIDAPAWEEDAVIPQIKIGYYGITQHGTGLLTAVNGDATMLGEVYSEDEVTGYGQAYIDPDRLAFSPNGDGVNDVVIPWLGLLRNAAEVRMEVLDAKGNVIATPGSAFHLRKVTAESCEYAYVAGTPMANADHNIGWDGTIYHQDTGTYETVPEGNYTIRLQAALRDGGQWQTVTMPVTVDFTPPKISKYRITRSGNNLSIRFLPEDHDDLSPNIAIALNGYTTEQTLVRAVYDPETGYYTGDYRLRSLDLPDNEPIHTALMVSDYAGNTTIAYYTINPDDDAQVYGFTNLSLEEMNYVRSTGGITNFRVFGYAPVGSTITFNNQEAEMNGNHFTIVLPLLEGENVFDVAIRDAEGTDLLSGQARICVTNFTSMFSAPILGEGFHATAVGTGWTLVLDQDYEDGTRIPVRVRIADPEHMLVSCNYKEIIPDKNGYVSFDVPMYDGIASYRVHIENVNGDYYGVNGTIYTSTAAEEALKDGKLSDLNPVYSPAIWYANGVAGVTADMLQEDGTYQLRGYLFNPVDQLLINGTAVEVNADDLTWSYNVKLQPGVNNVPVVAVKDGKNYPAPSQKILYETEGPKLVLELPEEKDGKYYVDDADFLLQGTVTTRLDDAQVYVNDTHIFGANDFGHSYGEETTTREFSYPLALKPGENYFTVIAYNYLGLSTEIPIILVYGVEPPTCTHEHTTTTMVPATCTEPGSETIVCDDCGETISVKELPALGHSIELKNAKEATCTEDGYTGDEICTVCGEIVKQGEVIPAHCPSKAFADLNTDRWYHEYTDYVIAKGLMNGMDETHFAPEGSLTRGQLVTTLYRLAGEPEVAEPATFADVKAGRYYTEAVAWAEENGIAKGITDTTFCPDKAVTREQAATFLYRYVTEYLEQEPATGADLSIYTDREAISKFARTAVAWATAEGFLQGFPGGSLQPRGTLTRAQMAKLLTILDQKF